MIRRSVICVALVATLTLGFSAQAVAIPHVLGYQYSKVHTGLVGRVWAYNWSITDPSSQWAGHVSALYINADGLDAPYMDNYIEAGLEKNSSTILGGDSRPVFFTAYEDYPNTNTQVWRSHGRATVGAWHDVKIANFQPLTGAPSDWAVYFNGVAKVSTARYSFKVGQPITASERYLYLDNNQSSFDNMKNRNASNTHSEWTSIATRDNDNQYNPFIVDGSAWRCVKQ